MTSMPVLYSFRRCPYAIRARLALAVSGIPYALREVHLAHKPAAMLAASPKATVPVLVLEGGTVIDESLDIMRWALARSDPEGWLERDDAELIALADGPFKANLDRYKYPGRYGPEADVYRARGLDFLAMIDARLSGPGQLRGARRGLADAAIMPFVRQYAAVEPAWFAAQPLPQLQEWLAGHAGSPLFRAVMERVAPWSPGDPAIVVSRANGDAPPGRARRHEAAVT